MSDWRSDESVLSPYDLRRAPGPQAEARGYLPAWHDRVVNYLTDAIYGDNANAQQRSGVAHIAGPDNPFNIPAQLNQGYNTAKLGADLRDPAQAGLGVAQMAMSLPFGIGKAPTQAATKGIRAYHGSPHDFDKFSLKYIGTGEGAQAYGPGLYFAEAEDVASHYKKTIGDAAALLKARPSNDVEQALQKHIQKGADEMGAGIPDVDTAFDWAMQIANRRTGFSRDEVQNAFQSLMQSGPTGRMYEVNIKANPEDFLDWDKPLSQQSEQVKWQLGYDPNKPDITTGDAFKAMERDIRRTNDLPEKDGREMLARELKKKGIPGIRYLDQGSRTAGEGSRNYAVWDDSIIEIIRKYGLAGLMAGGAAATAGGQAEARQ